MERLLDNIALLEYPKDKLEIQVLDDSTDESLQSTKQHIEKLQKTGLDIKHVTRTDRSGFKAGALKEGLKVAKGEFIAIFDADFLPEPNWLLCTVPYFKDRNIGVVQTRWGHINRNYSLLTKVQAFALDAHFTLEVETPAELPVVISAARSQQFRWNKGGAENFQKMSRKVIGSKQISLKTKFHGLLHLLNSTMFLNVLIVGLLSIPMLYIKNEYAHLKPYFYVMSFFVISSIIFFICYWYMFKNIYGGGLKQFIKYIGMFFTFFSIAMGFSLHNSIAVIEGHIGKRSEFVRTPKFNISTLKDSWKGNKYLKRNISINVIFEGILMLYFGFGMYSAFIVGDQGGDFGLFPFHLMLFVGFGFVFFKSLTSKA